MAAGTVKGRGSRLKSLVLALASTAVALLIGIWVTAYLTAWPPNMSAVGDGTVIYDPEIGSAARPSAHTRHIYPAIADRAAFAFDTYTDKSRRQGRWAGAAKRRAPRHHDARRFPPGWDGSSAQRHELCTGELLHDAIAADPRA